MTADMASSGVGRNVIYTLKVETDPRAKAELQKFKQSVLDMFKELGAKQAETRDHAMRGNSGHVEQSHAQRQRDILRQQRESHWREEQEKARHAAEAKRQAKEMKANVKELSEGVKESVESFHSLVKAMGEVGLVSEESVQNFEKLWGTVETGVGLVSKFTGVWDGASKAFKAYKELAASGHGGLGGLAKAGALGPTVMMAGEAVPVALMATAALSTAAGIHAGYNFIHDVGKYGFMGGSAVGGWGDRVGTWTARNITNVGAIASGDRMTGRLASRLHQQTGLTT